MGMNGEQAERILSCCVIPVRLILFPVAYFLYLKASYQSLEGESYEHGTTMIRMINKRFPNNVTEMEIHLSEVLLVSRPHLQPCN